MVKRKKKRTKNNTLIVVIILISVLLISYFGVNFSIEGIDDVFGDATIFSVDEVDSFGSGSGTEWVIALSMNDGSESVVGEFSADSLEKYNLKSVPATSFKIEFDLRNPVCNYDIIKDKNVIGELYYDFVTEECLANVCPYQAIDLDDLINKCVDGDGASQIPPVSGVGCERMIDLIQLGGDYTEWCYWLPEQSNVDAPGECRESTLARTVTVSNNPVDCGREIETTTTITTQISEGETGGDWQVMATGIVPTHDLYRIDTAQKFGYDAVVKVTLENGEEFECIIDPVTKSCDLGDFGNVKFAGNLLADKTCPVPSVDMAVLRDIENQEWINVDAGIGSKLGTYLTTLNIVKDSNVDYYTFTAIPEDVTTTSTSVRDFPCDPAVGNPLFNSITALNNLGKDIPDEKPPNMGFDCEVINDNELSCYTGSSVVYPLLKVTVKASKVGIYTREGQPEVLDVSLSRSGALDLSKKDIIILDPNDLTRVFVGVKNIGSEPDSFDVSLECPFPISQQSKRVAINSGASDTVDLLISGDGLIQQCEVKAVSVGSPSNVDRSEFSVVINPTCDQYGTSDVIFTEYGCIAQPNYPGTPCKNNEFWLDSLSECIAYSDISTGEDRLEILEMVVKEDCSRQCNGNKECTLSCLENGNVKPVCVGIGEMMTLNDFLCDYENQPNLQLPSRIQSKIWVDAPICDYVCEFGKTGRDCEQITEPTKFDYSISPIHATLIQGKETCNTCFDGLKNQNEEGIDCGGVCEEKYGLDKSCGKLRAPDHCFNHLIDGNEEGRDCGGSCDFDCDEVFQDFKPLPGVGFSLTLLLIGLVVVVTLAFIWLRFRSKKKKK